MPKLSSCLAVTMLLCSGLQAAQPWTRHTIDDSSRGADGVRMADANGDGLLDIATGWEEGGAIRVYLNPGPAAAKRAWPAVTVGQVKSPEDAVLVDVDGDGAIDVVSCCEGSTRTVYVHWAPVDPQRYLDSNAWQTEAIPATAGAERFMFALPMQIDGRRGVDLVVGSKEKGSVGWLQAAENPRDLAAWKWHRLYEAGWIMSLEPLDMDRDGDLDVVVSDRKGKSAGVLWLENPGEKAAASGSPWREHRIGAAGLEVMFLAVGAIDGETAIVVATRNQKLLAFTRQANQWTSSEIPNPYAAPHGKSVALGDLDGDGKLDLAHAINSQGNRMLPGVTWTSSKTMPLATPGAREWHDVSGPQGVKFDLLQLIDLDADGDLDIVGCEERDNLGVFWYENPRSP